MNTSGARPLRRIAPLMGTQAYKTYQIASPLTTHYKPATCQEVDCEQYRIGWRLRLDILQPQDKKAIKDSKRKFIVEDDAEGVKWLVFEAGQPCFQASLHRKSLERPEIYRVGRGDYRSYDERSARILTPENWLDDFATHQDKLKTLQERG